MPTREALLELARNYTAAWCSQEPSRVASFFAEGGSLTINDGETAAGREAIAGTARDFMTTFPDLCVMLDEMVVLNDEGTHADYRWTFTGGYGKVRISGVEHWQVSPEECLIAVSRGYFDTEDYASQMAQPD